MEHRGGQACELDGAARLTQSLHEQFLFWNFMDSGFSMGAAGLVGSAATLDSTTLDSSMLEAGGGRPRAKGSASGGAGGGGGFGTGRFLFLEELPAACGGWASMFATRRQHGASTTALSGVADAYCRVICAGVLAEM